jgi:hypothetical protein
MQREYKAGVLSGPNYALLTDRVLVEDEADVDKRRAEVGLSLLAGYRERLKQKYYPQNK